MQRDQAGWDGRWALSRHPQRKLSDGVGVIPRGKPQHLTCNLRRSGGQHGAWQGHVTRNEVYLRGGDAVLWCGMGLGGGEGGVRRGRASVHMMQRGGGVGLAVWYGNRMVWCGMAWDGLGQCATVCCGTV